LHKKDVVQRKRKRMTERMNVASKRKEGREGRGRSGVGGWKNDQAV